MIKNILIVTLLTGLGFSQQQIDIPWPTLADSPWPMIAHDPQLTGRSPYSGPKTPTIKWTLDLPYGIISGPVIGEDCTLYAGTWSYLGFVGDTNNYFYAITPDGNIKWRFLTHTPYSNASGCLINNQGTIFFGSLNSGWLYAIDQNGQLKWEYNAGGGYFKIMNIDLQGNIYITNTTDSHLYSFSTNGELNWKVSYGGGFKLSSPSISPDGNTIYISGIDSNLYALNIDGTIKWDYSCWNILPPLLIDNYNNIFFPGGCSPPGSFTSIDSAGNLNWDYLINNGNAFNSIGSPAMDYDGNIYFSYQVQIDSYNYGRIESIDYYGNYRWTYQFEQPGELITQPLVIDKYGNTYCGSALGYYYYAISNVGELLWKIPLNGYQVDNSTAIGSDGTLYIGTHKSSTHTTGEKTLIAIKDTGSASVSEINGEIKDYFLLQNYPNPFNPATHIDYQLKKREKVTLKVFNVMGELIKTLVDEEQITGYYSVIFDGKKLPSGVYYYELVTDKIRLTNKMILIK